MLVSSQSSTRKRIRDVDSAVVSISSSTSRTDLKSRIEPKQIALDEVINILENPRWYSNWLHSNSPIALKNREPIVGFDEDQLRGYTLSQGLQNRRMRRRIQQDLVLVEFFQKRGKDMTTIPPLSSYTLTTLPEKRILHYILNAFSVGQYNLEKIIVELVGQLRFEESDQVLVSDVETFIDTIHDCMFSLIDMGILSDPNQLYSARVTPEELEDLREFISPGATSTTSVCRDFGLSLHSSDIERNTEADANIHLIPNSRLDISPTLPSTVPHSHQPTPLYTYSTLTGPITVNYPPPPPPPRISGVGRPPAIAATPSTNSNLFAHASLSPDGATIPSFVPAVVRGPEAMGSIPMNVKGISKRRSGVSSSMSRNYGAPNSSSVGNGSIFIGADIFN